jgi:hypothetical protein
MHNPLKNPSIGPTMDGQLHPFFLKKQMMYLSTTANETPSINLVCDHQQGGWKIKQGFFGSKH